MNYDKFLNQNVVNIKPSGIRKFFAIAQEMENVISLGVGEPDFLTPSRIRQVGIETLEKGTTNYTSNAGLAELRKEIANYYSRKYSVNYHSNNEVLVTVGGSEAIDASIRAIVSRGDEVLVVEPSFVCYKPIVEMCGGVAVPLVTTADTEFKLTTQTIKDNITPKTKVIILPYPNNPTGAIMTKEELEEISKVIIENDLFVISDEIYSELTYNTIGHTSIASIDNMQERTIVINGFSKAFAMTGWRLGYALGPAPIIKQMTKIHQYAIMSAPTTSQYAAIEAMKNCDDDVARMFEDYNKRRIYTTNAFREIGLDCIEPQGAFYVFPCIKSTGLTSEEFAYRLINSKKVAVVPGNAFGDCGEGYIRVSYCYSIDDIKQAIRLIGEFIKELKDEG